MAAPAAARCRRPAFLRRCYAYLLEQEGDEIGATDPAAARALRARASKLFIRGHDYAMRGLEVAHHGFRAAFATDQAAALVLTTKQDTALLYWAGAGWAGAV